MFANNDLQREHYKTDWHRYNLKRKITGFPIVTEEQFGQKVIAYKKETADEKNTETKMAICKCCSKRFQSANAYENHLSSRKHKESETRFFKRDAMRGMNKAPVMEKQINDLHYNHFDEADIQENDCDGWITDHDIDDEDFDESKVIPETVCLFCNYGSDDVETNLIHMSVLHGFFLPYAEFCTNVGGMLYYLGLKVGSGNMCLVCNEQKKFYSLDACQKHMRDKGHCRVAHSVEEMIEFEDFYDYSTIYPKEEYIDKSYPIVLVDDGYTLTLPSGAEIGHRSLLRYYRQHLKPVEYGSRSDRQRKEILKKVMIGQYKELGWKGTSGTLAVQRAKDVRYMKKINSKNWMKLGLNNNRLFQSRGRNDQ
ncbi:zinc finger protein [Wuchereria bancrofti]|nr:zinc finger protein [Wuchereria bancrofti]